MPVIFFPPYINTVTVDPTDPYASNVQTLLHMDYNFIDKASYPKTFTAGSGVSISTARSKFGGASALFDGTVNSTLQAQTSPDYIVGTGDFTIEGWYYLTAFTGVAGGFFQLSNGGYLGSPANSLAVGTVGTGAWQIYANGTNTNSTSGAPVLNTWTHFALVRASGVTKLYIDGTSVLSITDTANYTASYLHLGAINASGYTLQGNLDEFRITVGVARYTGTFTPPTAAFVDPPQLSTGPGDTYFNSVKMLLHMNGASGGTSFPEVTGRTATVSGSVTTTTEQIKFGTASAKFNSGRLIFTPSSDMTFGTGDFTVEGWFYQTADNTYPTILEMGDESGVTGLMLMTRRNGGATMYAGGWVGNKATTLNAWNHIAWVRSSGVFTVYVNGVGDAGTTFTNNLTSTTFLTIGGDQHYGGNGGYYYPGYIDDFRVTKGVARYTGTFTPPTAPFPDNLPVDTSTITDINMHNVSFLLHGQGANNGTVFTDKTGAVGTAIGAPVTSTTQAKFGTSSVYLNGSSAIAYPASDAYAFGTGDFTVECWVYPTQRSACSIISASSTSGNSGMVLQIDGAGGIGGSTAAVNLGQSGGVVALNAWSHIALVRTGGTAKAYLNGIQVWSVSWAVNFLDTTLHIGQFTNGSQRFFGYMQDIRLTKGVARYTSNFTAPTATFPDIASDANINQVTFLAHADDMVDVKNHVITNSGVTISTTTKRLGTGSFRFGGSQYLALPISADYNFGTAPFTIEGWFNPDTVTGNQPIFSYTNKAFLFQLQGTAFVFYINGVASGWAGNVGGATANTWFHYALVRNASGVCTFYLNGVAVGQTPTHTEALGSSTVAINYGRDVTASTFFTGYMDELRITPGVARYTGTFTPSKFPYGDV